MTVVLYFALFGALGCLARYFISGGMITLEKVHVLRYTHRHAE